MAGAITLRRMNPTRTASGPYRDAIQRSRKDEGTRKDETQGSRKDAKTQGTAKLKARAKSQRQKAAQDFRFTQRRKDARKSDGETEIQTTGLGMCLVQTDLHCRVIERNELMEARLCRDDPRRDARTGRLYVGRLILGCRDSIGRLVNAGAPVCMMNLIAHT
jgi:hypothetical protein